MNISNLEMAQASMEIFGGFVSLMIVLIIITNRLKTSTTDKFKWIFLLIAGIFFTEACAYIFRGNVDNLSVWMTRICNFIVFFINILLADIYVRFIYSLLEEKGVKVKGTLQSYADYCFIAVFVILMINIPTKWMYYFDENNYYHRNNMWYVYTLLNFLCLIIGASLGVIYRKKIGRGTFISIIVYALFPVLAIGIQYFSYGLSFTNLGIALSAVSLLITYIQDWSKSENVDTELEQKKRKVIEMIVLFFIMVVSMSASIVSCVVSIGKISSENSEGDSLVIGHMVSETIEGELVRPITVSQTMAKSTYLAELMMIKDAKFAEAEIKEYLTSIKDGFGYQMAFAASDKSRGYYTYYGLSKILDVENDAHDIWYKEFVEDIKSGDRPYNINVDTDESNGMELSVFVNYGMLDKGGDLLGACGVAVNMAYLQQLINDYEEKYSIGITLINERGIVQISTNESILETNKIDITNLENVGSDEFYYEKLASSSRMTKYLPSLGWYIIVEDFKPNKTNIITITLPSIIIFLGGLTIMGIVFLIMMIREQKIAKALSNRRRVSLTDELTGLLNRRAYSEDCELLKENDDYKKYSIILMDVNGLKFVNDNLGHIAGDELLIGAATCMSNAFAKYGRVYRVGGDEFVALLKCSKNILEGSLDSFAHITGTWKGTIVTELSVSKGAAIFAEHDDKNFDEIVEIADKLMYEDKDNYYKRTGRERRK